MVVLNTVHRWPPLFIFNVELDIWNIKEENTYVTLYEMKYYMKKFNLFLLYFVLSTRVSQQFKEYVNFNSFHLCFLRRQNLKCWYQTTVTEGGKRPRKRIRNKDTNKRSGKPPNYAVPYAEHYPWTGWLLVHWIFVLIRSIFH